MEYEDFCPLTDLEHLNETLDKYGVAVLPNVLTDEQCEKCKSEVYEHLRTKLDVKTPDDYFEKLGIMKNGILNTYGVSLIKPVLDLKTEESVVDGFRKIWNETELTTSLDAMNIFPPPEQTTSKYFFKKEDAWFHADQASHKLTKCCVQSFAVLEPIEHGDSCLSVLLNSHNYFGQFTKHFNVNTNGLDWMLIKKEHYDWYVQRGCRWKMIMAPKGSMVFWDSRTVHMGTAPREDRPNKDRYRFIIYICYTPAKWQTADDREALKFAYVNNRSTAHWPYGVVIGGKTYGYYQSNDLENLSTRHKKYLGLLNE